MKFGDVIVGHLHQIDGIHPRLQARLEEWDLIHLAEPRSGNAIAEGIRLALSYTVIDVVAVGGRRRDDRYMCASQVRLVQAAKANARVPGSTPIRLRIMDDDWLSTQYIDTNIWHEFVEMPGLHRYWRPESARRVVRAAELALAEGVGGPLEETKPAYLAKLLGYSTAKLFKADRRKADRSQDS